MKLKEYYKNLKGEVVIGDVIRVTGSTDKDGIYIMLANELNPSIAQGAQRLTITSNKDYKFCEYGGLSCQIGDDDADVEILDNFFIKYGNKLNNNIMSNITTTIKQITRKEPEKAFVKAGFMDNDENITEDGKEALMYLLWKEKSEELKELADKLNKDYENI